MFVTLTVFLKEFGEKVNFENIQQTTNAWKITQHAKSEMALVDNLCFSPGLDPEEGVGRICTMLSADETSIFSSVATTTTSRTEECV